MRFMMLVKASKESEAGALPSRELLAAMGQFNVAETRELLAGFWIIDVMSKADALDWASRVPFTDGEAVEVRQVFEAEDFPAEVFPPEEVAREQSRRDELQREAAKR